MTVTAVADIALYEVTTTTEIPQIDLVTGVNRVIASVYTLNVVSDCTITTLTDKTISNIVYGVTLTKADTNILFLDSISTGHINNAYCGVRKYTLTPSTHTWLNIVGDTMSVETSVLGDVGVYPGIQLKIELNDYPMVTPIIKTFQVTITCTVTTLAFNVIVVDPLADTTIEVGIDTQPHDMVFSVTKTPNCVQDPTFTLTPALTFVTKTVNADGESGKVSIHDATLANQSVNNMVLTAVVDLQTVTSAFVVTILDPCKRAVFETTPAPMIQMNIMMPTTGLTDQVAKIWTDVERTQALSICPITATLSPTKAWMSLASDFTKVSVDANQIVLPTDVGTHTFILTVNELNWSASVTQKTYTFDVLIECNVASLNVDQSAANKNPYVLNEGSHVTQALQVSQNSICNYAYTYTHAFTKDGVSITKPAWLNFDDATTQYTLAVTAPADIGVYVITATTTTVANPVSGAQKSIVSAFTLTVVSDCTLTSFVTLGLTTMTQGVTVPTQQQNIFFTDTIATGHTLPNYCGTRTYVLAPGTATYAFISINGNNVEVQTNDEIWIGGPYTFTITATLTDYAMITQHQESFVVYITCGCQTHNWVLQVPVYTTLQIGIDSQPWTANFQTTQFPNCGNQVTFTMVHSNLFMTKTTLGIETGKVVVDNATISHHGVYSYSLIGVVDTYQVKTDFQVFIKNPCSTSVFETTPVPLNDMQIIMYYQTTETQTQNVKIWTDVERSYASIICPITAVLTPSKPYISLSSDFTTINVDASQASDLDVGLHTMTLTVNNSVFADPQVATAVYTFVLDLKACEVVDFVFVNPVTTFSYMITDSKVTTQPVLATLSNLNCLFPITYVTTYKRENVSITEPSYLARDLVTNEFNVETSLKADLGFYTVDVSASIPQVLLPGGIKTITFTFDVTIESDCKISVIDDRAINYMETIIGILLTQDSTFTNTRASLHNDLLHCGEYQLVLNPVHPFLNVLDTAGTGPYTLELYSTDVYICNLYTVSLTISLPEFPVITPVIKTFDVKVICNILSIAANPQPKAYQTYIIGVEPFLKIPFDFIQTPYCLMDITIDQPDYSYTFTRNFLLLQKEIYISTKNLNDAGVYKMKLTAFPRPGISVGVTKEVEFTLELLNICKTTQFEGKVSNLDILRQSPEFLQSNLIDLSNFDTLAGKLGVDCGAIIFSVKPQDKTEPVPDWIKIESLQKQAIVNLTQEQKLAFEMPLFLDMYLLNYPHIKYQRSFNVTLSSAGFQCMPNAKFNFITGDPDYQFGLIYNNATYLFGSWKLTQIAEAWILNDQQQELSLPAFADFNKDSLEYKISKPQYEQIGLYQLGLKLGYKEFPGSEVYCMKNVNIEYKTRFIGQIPGSLVIPCEMLFTYQLPEYIDVFDKKASIQLQLNEVEDFLVYETTKRTLTSFVDQDVFCKYSGASYNVKMILTDSVGGEIKYEIEIAVTNLNKVTAGADGMFGWTPEYALPPPKPMIKFVDQKGYVRVTFSRAIQIPTYDRYPEFRENERMRQNCTNGAIEACLQEKNGSGGKETKLRRQLLTEKEQELKEALEITNKGMVMVNHTYQPLIELDMLPGSEETDETIIKQFEWEVVDFTEEYMDFQLLYNQFPQISIHQVQDMLKVSFIGRQYFKAPDGQFFQESVTVQKKSVPTQIDPELGARMEAMGGAVKDAGVALGIGNFILNLFLGGVLSEMFAVMSKLQIMLHLLIVNVSVPPQTMIFMQGLLALCTFQIIEFDPYIRPMFGLQEDTVVVNQNLYYLGYTSTYFVVNMGNVLMLLFFELGMFAFMMISQKCKNKRAKKLNEKVKSFLFWNGVFRLLNEPYVVYVVSCLTQTLAMTWSHAGEVINNLLMIGMLIIITGFPIWIFFFVRKNKENLNKKKFMEKYEDIYCHLKQKSGSKWVLLEPCISSFRMMLTICALLYLQRWRTFQLMIAMYFHYAVIIYNGQVQPFKDKIYHFFQQFNEVFVMWTILILMTFADLIMDQDAFDTMGYVLIAVVLTNLLVNMLFIFGKAIMKNWRKFYIRFLIWRRKKLRASIERKRSQWEQDQQAALAKANSKAPLSPRSLRIWHRLRKDLGLSYDAVMIDQSQELSFNSDADLVISKKYAQALEANPINQLILQPQKNQEMLVENELVRSKVVVDEEMVEEQKETKEQRRRRLKKDKEDFASMLHSEYVVNPKTQDQMNAFYNNDRVTDYGKTYDNGGSQFQRTNDESWMRPPPIKRPPANDNVYNDNPVNNNEDKSKNFDNFNTMYTNYLRQPQDIEKGEGSLWGQPMRTIREEPSPRYRANSKDNDMNVNEPYVQRGFDVSDPAAQSQRVQKRQEGARHAIRSTNQARELFDALWKNDDGGRSQANLNQTRNQTGFVSIKTIHGNQNVTVMPEPAAKWDQDHWGNPKK